MPVCPLTGGLISHWFIKNHETATQTLRKPYSPPLHPTAGAAPRGEDSLPLRYELNPLAESVASLVTRDEYTYHSWGDWASQVAKNKIKDCVKQACILRRDR